MANTQGKDETRVVERADDPEFRKNAARNRAMRTKVNCRAFSLSAG